MVCGLWGNDVATGRIALFVVSDLAGWSSKATFGTVHAFITHVTVTAKLRTCCLTWNVCSPSSVTPEGFEIKMTMEFVHQDFTKSLYKVNFLIWKSGVRAQSLDR